MAEVTDFDLDARTVALAPVANARAPESLPYDTLVVAGGSQYSTSATTSGGAIAAEVKSLESALTVRGADPAARSRPPSSSSTTEARRADC